HIADQRNPAEAQRTAQPQDIIASVLVSCSTPPSSPSSSPTDADPREPPKGEPRIVASTYEPNRVAYRLVSELGLMRLPASLMDKVVAACERVREVEIEVAREKGETKE
ncbi:hypothetical protein JCM10212_003347, partial [Sporobolomyces blumeae]